jgi:hypothetical protein
MCSLCDDIELRIVKFRRFIAEPVDTVTKGRLTTAVAEMEAIKVGLHPRT